jgi:hypothetical protein
MKVRRQKKMRLQFADDIAAAVAGDEGIIDGDVVPSRDRKGTPGKRRSSRRLEEPFAMLRRHWRPLLDQAEAKSVTWLLAAIAYQMDRADFGCQLPSKTTITSETWAAAGDDLKIEHGMSLSARRCVEKKRERMLRVLLRIPGIVRLERRTGLGYIVHKGEWFDQAPPGREEAAPAGYLEYLKSTWWLKRRERRLALSGFRCEHMVDGRRCGETEGLEVDHLHYDTLGCEADEDLAVRCCGHHDEKHGYRNGD